MFRKAITTSIFIILVVALAACSSTSITSAISSTVQSTSSNSVQSKLSVGLLQLQGTNLAVTSQQAAALLPLWKAVKSLSTSSTTAPAEISALYQQIQDSLTPEQVTAIQKLTLTQTDLTTLEQRYGVQASRTRNATSATAAQASQSQANNIAGITGGPGGGSDIASITGGVSGQTTQTSSTTKKTTSSSKTDLNPMFAGAVIQMLQQVGA